MAIYKGLAAIRVRPDAEVIYIHENCKQTLKTYPGQQNKAQMAYVLKCDCCDAVIGEWSTKHEMDEELAAWYRAQVLVSPLDHI